MTALVAKRLFTVSDYYRMAEVGILSADDRVELIEGEIVAMSPIGIRHANCLDHLTMLLVPQVSQTAIVRVQGPIHLSDLSEPQPDIALLRRGNYSSEHPTPADVLLVIEVSDTTADYDQKVKMPLYARAGIPESWLVNLPKDVIQVHAEPVNGKYQQVRQFTRGETVVSQTIANLTLAVNDILG